MNIDKKISKAVSSRKSNGSTSMTIRVPKDLLQSFQLACEASGSNSSEVLRIFMDDFCIKNSRKKKVVHAHFEDVSDLQKINPYDLFDIGISDLFMKSGNVSGLHFRVLKTNTHYVFQNFDVVEGVLLLVCQSQCEIDDVGGFSDLLAESELMIASI